MPADPPLVLICLFSLLAVLCGMAIWLGNHRVSGKRTDAVMSEVLLEHLEEQARAARSEREQLAQERWTMLQQHRAAIEGLVASNEAQFQQQVARADSLAMQIAALRGVSFSEPLRNPTATVELEPPATGEEPFDDLDYARAALGGERVARGVAHDLRSGATKTVYPGASRHA